MKTRIKYSKTKWKHIKKSQPFTSEKGHTYIIMINTEKMEYRVKNFKSLNTVRKITDKERNVIKTERGLQKAARKALISLGVKLNMELRGLDGF